MDPRLIQLMQHLQQSRQPVRFDDGGEVGEDGEDLSWLFGGGNNYSGIDPGWFGGDVQDYSETVNPEDILGSEVINNLIGEDAGGEPVNVGLGGAGEDTKSVADLFDLSQLSPEAAYGYDAGVSMGDASGGEDLGSYLDLALSGSDAYRDLTQEDMIKGITATGNVQTVAGTDLKVIMQDDGTAVGWNPETGTHFSLEPDQVNNLVKQGKLNSFGSGYNTMTGGNAIAPGGGKQVTTSDGKKVTVMPDGKVVGADGKYVTNTNTIRDAITRAVSGGGGTGTGSSSNNMSWLLPLLLMMMAMNRNQQPSGQAVIPKLSAERTTLPYQQVQQAPGYRPGQGGVRYVSDVSYKPMAAGGIAALAGGGKGLLHGPGDGVSDSIPAMIGSDQPARLARGEYVVDARTVAELGNGSTDAGAERLDEMRQRVLSKRKQAKMGQDTKAYRHLPA